MVSPEIGLIFDVRRFSIHDGPGIRTTVFMKGCPLACWWCHNPEGQSPKQELWLRLGRCIRCGECAQACPEGAIIWRNEGYVTELERCTLCGDCLAVCATEARQIVGQWMSVAQVLAELERDVPFYDESGGGITISGGEPLQQYGFLLELLRACKQNDLHTVLDTCGYAPWRRIYAVSPYVDVFLYDLKLIDDSLHRQFTGVSNRLILQNLRRLLQIGREVIVRVPVIPGVNDAGEHLHRLAAFLVGLPVMPQVELLPYHLAALGKYERLNKEYLLRDVLPPPPERMQAVADILQRHGLMVKMNG